MPDGSGKIHEISNLGNQGGLAYGLAFDFHISELKVNINQNVVREGRATESCAPLTLKPRLGKLLCEIFEGHEEYLGVTPDYALAFSQLGLRDRTRIRGGAFC